MSAVHDAGRAAGLPETEEDRAQRRQVGRPVPLAVAVDEVERAGCRGRCGGKRRHRDGLRHEGLHAVEDRAHAEVSVEEVLDLLRRRRRALGEQADHAHHPARRAETALRAVVLDQPLLDRVETRPRRADALDGRHRDAVERAHGVEAAVHGDMLDLAAEGIQPRDDDGAGAAARLPAHELRAGQAEVGGAQQVDQHLPRVRVVEGDQVAVQRKGEGARRPSVVVRPGGLSHRASLRRRAARHQLGQLNPIATIARKP